MPLVVDAAPLIPEASTVFAPTRDQRDVNRDRLGWGFLIRGRRRDRDSETRRLHPSLRDGEDVCVETEVDKVTDKPLVPEEATVVPAP